MSLRQTVRHSGSAGTRIALLLLSLGAGQMGWAQSPSVAADAQPSGEVEVFAERGTQISVDGEPAQTLPLSAPLLLRAGPHVLSATQGRSTLTAQVDVRAGRAQEVRFSFSVQAVSITVPPHALLLEQYEGIPKEAVPELAVTTVRALSKQRLTLLQLPREAVLPDSCLKQTLCLVDQATKQEADYAVVITVVGMASPSDAPDRRSYQLGAQIVDRKVGQKASERSDSCMDCSVEQLKTKLSQVLSPLASAALSRKKGVLRIDTQPAHAAVFLQGERAGTAPLVRTVWAGTTEVRATLPGYRDLQQRVDVTEGAESSVTLKFDEAEQDVGEAAAPIRSRPIIVLDDGRQRTERAPRPRWRLIAGATGIGVGGVLLGIGGGALSVDGQCITAAEGVARHCDALYATKPLGIGLVAAGSALVLGGVLTMAWPGRVIPPRRDSAQGASK